MRGKGAIHSDPPGTWQYVKSYSMKKIILVLLVLLNVIVLTGQIWPEGAPPFARTVNIFFLSGSLLFFGFQFLKKSR
jgi:hypothetical protein